ncbi:pyridoxal phosphate-dependent decarboxylase family protein [Haliangium ochraceum]|uniref:Pyridoxal-dependent decarboxylase n=1 Tax=Haliangium ochraceum (strain DSM 14365 / JCM 11303 / SMP-2) TaxID=502025 RepID=D0LMI0_HALO1|nr:pyridoxal-dependent decarboxylase [Haliangium ochraceum]ACY18667.1 Pyridoxal-dependent decarboxylase [Haliangium ochraceum DSM 14365]
MSDNPDIPVHAALGALLARVVPALETFLARDDDRATLRAMWRRALDTPLPETGQDAESVLDTLSCSLVAHGLPLHAPGFCAWANAAPTLTPAVASFAASLATPQRWWVSPGNFLEGLAQRWLGALLGLPAMAGSFTSGGAVANLVALAAARQHAGARAGIDIAEHGLAALPQPRVYASERAHHTIARALAVLGLGRAALRSVPLRRRRRADEPEQLDLAWLRAALAEDRRAGCTPVAIVATAGDTATGAIDPVDEMRALARSYDTWLHVDGAYGGFGVLDERVRARFGDLSEVDSFVVNPHKWLAVPVGCGAVFVRQVEYLESALALASADYLPYRRRGEGDPASAFDEFGEGSPAHGLDHSAPARGVAVWAALAELGRAGMKARVRGHLDCARHVAARVAECDELELLAPPVLSICCFRYRPPGVRDQGALERVNAAIVRELRARGRVVPSSARVQNKLAIRPCFLGARTTREHADLLVDEVLAVGRGLAV